MPLSSPAPWRGCNGSRDRCDYLQDLAKRMDLVGHADLAQGQGLPIPWNWMGIRTSIGRGNTMTRFERQHVPLRCSKIYAEPDQRGRQRPIPWGLDAALRTLSRRWAKASAWGQ